jgi:hypothetical protein
MLRERSELERRRGALTRSPELGENQANTYRRNSDALALDRAGVKHERPDEIAWPGEADVAAETAIRDAQRELRDIDAEIKLRPWSRGEIWTRGSPSTHRPLSALPSTRRAVDVFDHPGLFVVRLARPQTRSAAAKRHERAAVRSSGARVAPSDRHKRGLHRYCSGCAQETEHAAWSAEGCGRISSIRWPTTEPAIGTTICLNCGQCRAASPQPRPPAWSRWPRIATPSVADGEFDSQGSTAKAGSPRRSSTWPAAYAM